MANISRAPFFVPRPAEDQLWSSGPQSNRGIIDLCTTELKWYGSPGQVPTKSWSPIYNSDDQASYQEFIWVNHTAQLVLTEAKFFGRNGQAPTKNWNSIYTQDDASVWNASPIDSTILAFLTKQRMFGVGGQVPAKQWRYDYDDAASWQFKAPHNGTLSVVTSPFVPSFWRYNIDDASTWNASPIDSAIIQSLTQQKVYGAGGQVTTKLWHYDYDDASAWQFLASYNATLNAVTSTLFPTGPFYVPRPSDDYAWSFKAPHNGVMSVQPSPFGPVFWKYGIDDASVWNAASIDSTIIQSLTQQKVYGTGGQVPTQQWHYDYDDASTWQFLAPHNGLLSVVASPFSPVIWRYNIDDPAVWSGSPTKDELLFPLLTAAGQVKSRQWVWGNDDASYWSGQPFAVSSMQVQLTYLGKVPTKQWHYDIDDAAIWWNWITRNITISTAVNKPLTLPAQTFILSSDEPWTLTTQRNLQTDSIILPPFKSRQPKLDADDPSVWYNWTNRNLVDLIVSLNPFIPVFYRFHADDPATWQQPPQRSIGLPFVPAINNRWQLAPGDDTSWSFTLRQNQALSTPTQSPFSVRWRSDIDEPALWQRLIFRSIALPTVPAINNRYFQYIPDDQPWTALAHRNIGAMITVTAPPPPFTIRQPSFAFDDHSSYQWPMKCSIILSLKWNINLERIGSTLAERRIALASLERRIITMTPEIRIASAPDEDS